MRWCSISSRDDLKVVYDLHYKTHKNDTSPEEVLAYFGALWHLMVVDKRIRVREGNRLEFTSRSTQQSLSISESCSKGVIQSSNSPPQNRSAGTSTSQSRSRSGRAKQRVQLAVDQHLTGVDKVLQDLGPNDSAQGDKSQGTGSYLPLSLICSFSYF